MVPPLQINGVNGRILSYFKAIERKRDQGSPPFMGATSNYTFFPCYFSDTRFKVESENVTGSPLKPRASNKRSSHKVVVEP